MPAEPPPRLALDHRPVAAIFRSPIFNPSETFIQAHATSLRRYQPLIVGMRDKGNAVPALRGRILLADARLDGSRLAHFARPASMTARLRCFSPRLLHAHFGPDGLAALPLARALGIPLVTTLHGYEIGRSRFRMLTSGRLSWMRYALGRGALMKEGDLFLAVSDALRRRAIDQGYPAGRIVTHYNGVDLERFRGTGRPAEAGLVLHVCRLVEKKGTGLLVEAFAALKAAAPGARLVILGDGPLLSRLKEKAARLGLGNSVEFLGRRSQQDVADWMARAWLLAVPSITASDGDAEGLPTVLFEAAAGRLPVVASDHSGIPEAVVDGKTGFIVPEGEAGPLAARMLDLLRSPDLRSAMAGAARRLAEERFDAVRQVGLLEGHYDRLVQGGAACG